jgi:hypothetical protein
MTAEETIDLYCAAWTDADPARRRALLRQVWAAGASYTDPTVHTVGETALLDHIAGVQARRPGTQVLRTSNIECHHDVARFAWAAVMPDGTKLRDGIDIALFDDAGRLLRIIGFFGPLPER